MGNCLNYSSSSSVAAAKEMNSTKPLVNTTVTCCDERTTESSTTTSPPISPIKSDTYDLHVPSPQQQHNASPPSKDEGETINKTPTTVMEQQRLDGQERLRELVITGAKQNNIDWASIISLAEDLQRKEQSLLKSKRSSRINNTTFLNKSSVINRKSISRRQAFFDRRRKQREIKRRKKIDNIGSFSVNLLNYMEKDESCNGEKERISTSTCENDHTTIATTVSENDVLCYNQSWENFYSCAYNFNENESEDNKTDDIEDEKLDVFEDDIRMNTNSSSSKRSLRSPYQIERTATPLPIIKPKIGSFLAATTTTSLFDSDECSSSSSSCCSELLEKGNNLMTIDENTSVADW